MNRNFSADGDLLWVQQVSTWNGWLYLAIVPMIVGGRWRRTCWWRVLAMAISIRMKGRVVHHSDQGSQYTAPSGSAAARPASVDGLVGDAYDNAMCESFFAKC